MGKGVLGFSVVVPDMGNIVDGEEDGHDQGCKNKRKLAHPSEFPASLPSSLFEFPRYALPISQSLGDFDLSKLGSDLYGEESEVHMHELVDWNDPIATQLEELLLSNLKAVFRGAIEQIVEFGFSEDIVEMAISRKALYMEEGDPVANIVRDTVNVLKGKDGDPSDIVFENFQHLLHYTMLEMIGVVREVKPSLTVAEAMWVLLICDLNISLACAAEDRLGSIVCNEENSTFSCIPQWNPEAKTFDLIPNCSPPTLKEDSSPNHQNHKPEASKLRSSLNAPNSRSPLASEQVKLKEENILVPITAEKPFGTSMVTVQECKSGTCSKRHTRKEMATLRQKFLHMEKAYRACGKGGFRSGKITSIGGLVVEKRLKVPSEIPNQKMKCGSSNNISTKGARSADKPCHVSKTDAPAIPEGVSSGTLPTKDAISTTPITNTNTSAPSTTCKLSSHDTQKILDYCAGIPFDEALGKYVPRNDKDGVFLKLICRVQELQDELQSWNNWANQKVMQVTARVVQLQAEFKALRKEKQEAEQFKKDKKILEENAVKRISEMENAVENTKTQMESANSATLALEAENALLKKELDAAKSWGLKSTTSYQQALEREQIALKQVQSWEGQKSLLRDELEGEKLKLSNLQQELDKEKSRQVKVEGRFERERVATGKVLAQAASIRKEREQIEARIKLEEDKIRKKAASDLQDYVEHIAKLEHELVELKLKSDSEKIAALRRCIDGRNRSFSRTKKSTPMVKGNKKSEISQTPVSCQDQLEDSSVRRERECVMCLSEEMSVVFLPCAHQVVCPDCNELHEKQGMKECPSCRAPIQHRVHARFAGH